jgi:hypothetical protein
VLLNDTEGVLAGLYRSAAHFLDAQGSHGPLAVLDHSQDEDPGGKKFFNPRWLGCGLLAAEGAR